MAPALETQRGQLLNSLKGQKLAVPNLLKFVETWPRFVHPEVNRLREDIRCRLEDFVVLFHVFGKAIRSHSHLRLFPCTTRLQRMKNYDIGLFGASWWPYASFEELRIATYLSLWLFAWDDEIDSSEFSSLVGNFDTAEDFCMETIAFIKNSLDSDKAFITPKNSSNDIITCFRPVGEAIAQSYTAAQLQSFSHELMLFIEMTGCEQACQMRDELPSVEDYERYRMGLGAVGVCLAITEFCFSMEVPRAIMEDEHMKALWCHTNVIVTTTNDILSLKKEVAQGQVDTLTPLLYCRTSDLQAATDTAVESIRTSIRGFEDSARQLFEEHANDQEAFDKCMAVNALALRISSGGE